MAKLALILAFVGSTACSATPDSVFIHGPDGRNHALSGDGSWYGERFQGRRTGSGEPFDVADFTAAHRTLAFQTVVRVIDPATHKSVVVRINDRGPFTDGRVIDLSEAAANDLDMIERGVIPVTIDILEWGSR